MTHAQTHTTPEPGRDALRAAMTAGEPAAVNAALAAAELSAEERAAISADAAGLVRAVRGGDGPGVMETFLAEYGLSTREGVALMCLAEALLRVPDAATVDALIEDKIAPHDWAAHLGDSGSVLVNASTWALMLTGRVLEDEGEGVVGALRGLVRRMGEPVIRRACGAAMREMGAQFVLGRDIGEALKNGAPLVAKGYAYSFDMLGEAARTHADADRYFDSYAGAMAAVAKAAKGGDVRANPGLSVKLSALHPRYEAGRMAEAGPALAGRLLELARAAKAAGVGLNVDAEEADRLEPSLDVIARALADPSLKGWDGFGVVVQAYGLRAAPAIDWLHGLAEALDRRIMVRLVKGAYWDTEVRRAQTLGLSDYPVFTRKAHTDANYLGCARRLMGMRERIYPQFATHNAHSAAAVLRMAGARREDFEFQRLHGMGEALHEALRVREGVRCRIYAPVGAHRDLLAYLVRRLLENGANSSFVHQIVDEDVAPETIAADPLAVVAETGGERHPLIPAPAALWGAERRNSQGWDLTDPGEWAAYEAARAPFASPFRWEGGDGSGEARELRNPARPDDLVGLARELTGEEASAAVGAAQAAQPGWAATPVAERAGALRRAADLYEANAGELFALVAREAGKTPLDAVAELREAVDFLRYYAAQAAEAEAGTSARGVIVCVSPWNFPLAIFSGQVAAALVTGNAVVAKPAEQTPLVAARAVALLHAAGVPADALRLALGDGPTVGAALTADPRIAGVCFTGSTDTAKAIERQLAKTAPAAMLIAETGGLNAMLVDSTALPEQAVRDIVASAFQSAGQRCSALRVLYVQKDIAKGLIEMIEGAMDALAIGDPWGRDVDAGPVIDAEAQADIEGYVAQAEAEGRLIKKLAPPQGGCFAGPAMVRVNAIADMPREVFGPVLHVATFEGDALKVAQAVNARGFGLTFGLHTRIDGRVQALVDALKVGNVYVNRNQIGAVVGSQPFGGEGLSGTGPKAGGPHYLRRFRLGGFAGKSAQAAPAAPAAAVASALAGLEKAGAAAWAARGDRVAALRAALRGKAHAAMAEAAAVDMGPIDLPGPTGEANQLRLAPRGVALCLGPDAEALTAQAVKALAMGCAVLAVAPGATQALAALAAVAPVAALDGTPPPEVFAETAVACVGWDGPAEAVRGAMAARKGALTPLVTAGDAASLYAVERVVSVDLTAAGGDAALLAAAA
ncbi:bifunctional proline dehydrogenase/L-glutamate gamma-semialdehyde dehydrogenase PutA [Rubrimonas cliftonensis]|uniref:Bifunctional protein PutA n=1 Tax=Rubrimonas cliftonensis TaxID=89524 RepID=A0A1H4B3U8_9RHOB|nr:bifunctional proline dehydrogenase/L-glutamate gamma-semialdehyde dehydrogenase PutA [Rubrimonas cliftonensis]SEA42830.1 L-proline dehydrogenase /delta-1-pyrroline-5-carboxylate dehydrogenase [Rubrimonas cliftonensis]